MAAQAINFPVSALQNPEYNKDTRVLSFDAPNGQKVTVTVAPEGTADRVESLVFADGTELSLKDLAKNFNLNDLATAAGPGAGAGAGSGGAGEYADNAGDLLGGIDRMGSLGTDFWGRGVETPEVALGTPFAGAGATGPAPFITLTLADTNGNNNGGGNNGGGGGNNGGNGNNGGGGSGSSGSPINLTTGNLLLNEAHLPNGTDPQQDLLTGSIHYTITTNAGVGSILINGYSYSLTPDGSLNMGSRAVASGDGCLQMKGGQLTQNPDGSYDLRLDVELVGRHQHEDGNDRNTADSELNFSIRAITPGGQMSGLVTSGVDVIDDVPEAQNDGTITVAEGSESQVIDLLANDKWGADEPANKTVESATISNPDPDGDPITLILGGTTEIPGFGKVTLTTDGKLTFEAAVDKDAGDTGSSRTVTYTIRDADGDLSRAEVVLERTTLQHPTITINAGHVDLTVYEQGLTSTADRSEFSSKQDPNTAVTVTAEAGLASLAFTVPGVADPLVIALNSNGNGSGSATNAYGTFNVIVNNGKVGYYFTLKHTVNNEAPGNPDWLSSDDDKAQFAVSMTATDTIGQTSLPQNIVVTIIDDIPTIQTRADDNHASAESSAAHAIASTETVHGNLDLKWGADDMALSRSATNGPLLVNGKNNDEGYTKDGFAIFTLEHGVLLLHPKTGEYTYTPKDTKLGQDHAVITIKDGDGDTATTDLFFDVVNSNTFSMDGGGTVHESLLNNGTGKDAGDGHGLTAGGTFTLNGSVGSLHITLGGEDTGITALPTGSDPVEYTLPTGHPCYGDTLTITNNGDGSYSYTYTLGHAKHHLTDAGGNKITAMDIDLEVSGTWTNGVSFGGAANNGSATITVMDDDISAKAGYIQLEVTPAVNYCVTLVLDMSGSMNYGSVSGTNQLEKGEQTRFQVAKAALLDLLAKYDAAPGDVTVDLILFSSAANTSKPLNDVTVAQAIKYLNEMASPNTNNTNYDQPLAWALNEVRQDLADYPTYKHQVFFISDGEKNQDGQNITSGNVMNGVNGASNWSTFIKGEQHDNVDVYAIGVGSGVKPGGNAENQLKAIINQNETNGDKYVNVSDFANLSTVLTGLVEISADLAANNVLGADGVSQFFGIQNPTTHEVTEINWADKSKLIGGEFYKLVLEDDGKGNSAVLLINKSGHYTLTVKGDVTGEYNDVYLILKDGDGDLLPLSVPIQITYTGSGSTPSPSAAEIALPDGANDGMIEASAVTASDISDDSVSNDILFAQAGDFTITGHGGHDLIIAHPLDGSFGDTSGTVAIDVSAPYTGDLTGLVGLAGLIAGNSHEAELSNILDYLVKNIETIADLTAAGMEAGDNYSLFGGAGNDLIIGSGGDDVIYGGTGDDVLFGGHGNDIFAWKNTDMGGGNDYIADFQLGKDHLRFDDLFDNNKLDDLGKLLEGGAIKLSVENSDKHDLKLEIAATDNNAAQTVHIHLADGADNDSVQQAMATAAQGNSNNYEDQAELLRHMILSNTTV